MSRWLEGLSIAGMLAGAVLLVIGLAVSLDKVLLHGFSPNCSDGNPAYDPSYCGVTWLPGLPAIAVAVLGLVLLDVCAWKPSFHRALLLCAGVPCMVLAVLLLWTHTWAPLTPEYPEPAWPQLILFGVGLAAVLAACGVTPRLPRRRARLTTDGS